MPGLSLFIKARMKAKIFAIVSHEKVEMGERHFEVMPCVGDSIELQKTRWKVLSRYFPEGGPVELLCLPFLIGPISDLPES